MFKIILLFAILVTVFAFNIILYKYWKAAPSINLDAINVETYNSNVVAKTYNVFLKEYKDDNILYFKNDVADGSVFYSDIFKKRINLVVIDGRLFTISDPGRINEISNVKLTETGGSFGKSFGNFDKTKTNLSLVIIGYSL